MTTTKISPRAYLTVHRNVAERVEPTEHRTDNFRAVRVDAGVYVYALTYRNDAGALRRYPIGQYLTAFATMAEAVAWITTAERSA